MEAAGARAPGPCHQYLRCRWLHPDATAPRRQRLLAPKCSHPASPSLTRVDTSVSPSAPGAHVDSGPNVTVRGAGALRRTWRSSEVVAVGPRVWLSSQDRAALAPSWGDTAGREDRVRRQGRGPRQTPVHLHGSRPDSRLPSHKEQVSVVEAACSAVVRPRHSQGSPVPVWELGDAGD